MNKLIKEVQLIASDLFDMSADKMKADLSQAKEKFNAHDDYSMKLVSVICGFGAIIITVSLAYAFIKA